MELSTPLRYVSGIGPLTAKKLEALNLFTVEDLITHYPFRYEDFTHASPLSQAKIGDVLTIKGELWSINNTYTRFKKILTKAILNDGTGSIEIIWFNQPWLIKNLKAGDRIQVSGKIGRSGSKTSLVSPQWEKITDGLTSDESALHTGRLVPVYPETFGLTSKWIRQKIADILPKVSDQIKDVLPEEVKQEMWDLKTSISQIHLPTDLPSAQKARERLSFDELFFIQLATQKKRLDWQEKQILKPLPFDQKIVDKFIKKLPFELTGAQLRVIREITQDLKIPHPMNRLVQGEVGSGKTVVAAVIIYIIFLNQQNSIIMAPTEILAFQHFQTLTKLLEPYGISIGIYTGSRKSIQNSVAGSQLSNISPTTSSQLPSTSPHVIVGTHALLSDKLTLDNVGLVVVDEQQRFGVEQRSLLRNKAKLPHFLTMTATPIPRTVALTVYGDLDLSIINELPKGRKVVKTHYVPHQKRGDAYNFIKDQVKKGFQVYIITPLIEESETLTSAKAAKVEYEKLQREIFPDLKLGLLHGRLKSKDKEQVITDFKDKKIDILISTSVVEVGVDIPNATIMVVEGAERFGLAQLHQLRGRVGRGDAQSYNFLFAEAEIPSIINRLKNLERIHDGLKLAELDLKIRGSGEIFGTRQSGDWNLKIASLSDSALVEKTRYEALKLLKISPKLDKYPPLASKLSQNQTEIMPD